MKTTNPTEVTKKEIVEKFVAQIAEKKADAPTATITEEKPRKRAIALMGPAALRAVAETRQELKNALKGYDVICRRLGDGDPAIRPLIADQIDHDTVLIGFSVPTNLVVRAKRGIEIPVGRSVNRTEISSKQLDAPKVEALIKALQETGRVALRAYTCQVAPLIDHEEADFDLDEEAESIQF